MALLSLAVLPERELLEVVRVFCDSFHSGRHGSAVRGILSDLSEANVGFFSPSLSWCFLLSFNVIATSSP